MLEENDLDYFIADSVFNDDAPRNSVMDQSPAAMSTVKKGRKIYLTVNSLDVPEVEMPDIAGIMSFEQAKKTLEGKGLVVGFVTKQPDPSITSAADMPVFEQLYRGAPISPGTKVKRKSKIDLVVGVMENQSDTSHLQLDTLPASPSPSGTLEGIDN